jgi:hypothetical protein
MFGAHAAIAGAANRPEIIDVEVAAAMFGEYMSTFIREHGYSATAFKMTVRFKILTAVCQPYHFAEFLGDDLLASGHFMKGNTPVSIFCNRFDFKSMNSFN